jgi:uncharacterized membrane protein HdeD (DUF308 family)
MGRTSARGWVILARITLMVLGTVAIACAVSTTLASGAPVRQAAVARWIHADRATRFRCALRYLLDGIIPATVGTLLVMYPGFAALTLTLVLSLYLIVGGAFKTIGSIALQFPSWGWSVASGLLSVAFGVMLAIQKIAFSRALDDFNHASERCRRC